MWILVLVKSMGEEVDDIVSGFFDGFRDGGLWL
jgi:hypothetical protein